MNQNLLPEQISANLGPILKTTRLHGGDINSVYHLKTADNDLVLKTNDSPLPGMFEAEAKGLDLLRDGGLPVPKVIDFGTEFLLLEYLPAGKHDPENAGHRLGKLHAKRVSTPGLDHDNYIGILPQSNKNPENLNWANFYIEHRIRAQLRLLQKSRGLAATEIKFWDGWISKLETYLTKDVPLALLHGDLWSGNLYYAQSGAFFIDCAVYNGDPYVDLAMTTLFGRFPSSFYEAYKEIHSMQDFHIFEQIYHVYPLLVHANIFGGSYYHSARECAARSLHV